jgi:antitoxin ParD1/3/4
MTVQLVPELEKYVNEMVDRGQYASASEAINEGIRLLQVRGGDDQTKLLDLQQELAIGITQANRGELLDGEEFMAQLRQRHAFSCCVSGL